MSDSDTTIDILPQRLCSEVKLFDLCELTSCDYKIGRFCSDQVLLSRFEKIADDEPGTSERYVLDELDDSEPDEGAYYEDDAGLENEYFDSDDDNRWRN
jgi:hypothetical protein